MPHQQTGLSPSSPFLLSLSLSLLSGLCARPAGGGEEVAGARRSDGWPATRRWRHGRKEGRRQGEAVSADAAAERRRRLRHGARKIPLSRQSKTAVWTEAAHPKPFRDAIRVEVMRARHLLDSVTLLKSL
uniref:Uncharacterized protein n=1 Tax=Oryza rufipogon TaxID=4529 RepID=A0A0E0R424_ORYRU